MPDFTFKGFAAASAVAIIAAQAGQTASASVLSWGVASGPTDGTVSIEVDHLVPAIAPAQVWVKATGYEDLAAFEETGSVYDGAHHEYYHFWTVNGEPLDNFVAPQNMLSTWNNPNQAQGREVAFCLNKADTYVIDLLVVDKNGKTAARSTSAITVVEPETHFGPIDRIYVALDGDFLDKPAASVGVTSLDGLKAALETFSNPPWVRFKSGEEFDFSTYQTADPANTGWLRISSARPFAYMSAFGSGEKPVMRFSTRADRNELTALFEFWRTTPVSNVVIRDLEFRGEFDAASETGSTGQSACVSLSSVLNVGTFFTFYNLSMDGVGKAFNILNDGADIRVMIADCDVTNWRDYAIFGGSSTSKVALLGNRLAQNINATHGGDKGDALVSVHAPVRITRAGSLYIAQNDMFSRTGWSSGTGGRADQPCLRLYTVPEATQTGTIERNVLEGGYQIINHESANPTVDVSTPGNLVIEQNLLLATAKTTGTFVSAWRSGTTVRNNYMVYPDVPTLGSGTEAIKFALDGSESPENPDDPIRIYSNTYLNMMSSSQDGGGAFAPVVNRDGRFTNFTVENNVWHKPTGSSAFSAGSVDVTGTFAEIEPRFAGVRYGFDLPEIILPAGGVPAGASLVLPYTLFTQLLQDKVTTLGDNTTDQTYWQTFGGTRHALYVYGDQRKMYQQNGHMAVSFNADNITIANTSGVDWGTGGEKVRIHLDRVAAIPAMDETYKSPSTLPKLRPVDGTAAYQGATAGLSTPQDFENIPRAEGAESQGVFEPSGG